MTSVNTLKDLLYRLKREEIKSLINFLKSHQREFKGQQLKSIKLVEILVSSKNYSSNELQIALYGRLNYGAFNKLVNRLKDKIYEVLIFDNNLINSQNYSDRNKTIFAIRKKLLQSEVMFVRGMNSEVENFQNKIILSAKQFEIYDGLIEALSAKQRYLSFRVGSNANLKIKKEIMFYEQSRLAYNRALDIYYSIAAKINFSTSYLEYKNELESSLTILKDDFEHTSSSHVGYHYLLLLTEYHQNNLDFINAQETLIKLKELIENNISIYTTQRFGTVLINISNNELLMYNFNNCLLHARKAVDYFSDSTINTGVAREIEFHALFYLGKHNEAEALIEKLYHASRNAKTPFLYGKRAYLLGCLKTLEGEYQNSKELLREVKDIERDKEGWNIEKRILMIINQIETEEFDIVDSQVLNLQKHMKRTLKIKHVPRRNVIILRILLKLINEQFDFKKVYQCRQRYFNLLESNDPLYRWRIKSPELIIFHEWFNSKVNGRKYDHLRAIKNEKKKFLKSIATTTLN